MFGRHPKNVHLALVSLCLAACNAPVQEAKNPQKSPITASSEELKLTSDAPQLEYLKYQTVSQGAPLVSLPIPGKVVVNDRLAAEVFASVHGRIESVAIDVGQHVEKGAKLFALRSATLPDLFKDASNAKTALAARRTTYERIQKLVEMRALPGKDLVNAQHDVVEAQAAVDAATARLSALQIAKGSTSPLTWVRAPRAGLIIDRTAVMGMEVGPETTLPLAVIAELSEVLVVAEVSEAEASHIAIGSKAQIVSAAGSSEKAIAEVSYVGNVVDPVRRFVPIRLRIKNANANLRPNGFVTVQMEPPADVSVITVPSEAVVTDGDTSVVFVKTINPGGTVRLRRREVNMGRSNKDRVEILGGLSEGESVVTSGALLVLNTIDIAE